MKREKKIITLLTSVTFFVMSIFSTACTSSDNRDNTSSSSNTEDDYVLSENINQEDISTLKESDIKELKIDLSDINSEYAMLIDSESGEIIAEKNGDTKIAPASMTKIMTAILAIENFDDMNTYFTMPSDAVISVSSVGGSLAGFYGGETVTSLDLIYGILLPSGCECCIAAGTFISGSENAFVELMNQKAAELGMTSTHFANTTGLPNENHYSTVHDIALLMRYASKNDTFRQVDSTTYYTTSSGRALTSTMFSKINAIYGDTYVIGGKIIGGKTGTTDEAGSCLCSFAEIFGKEYVLCTANAAYSGLNVADAKTIYNRLGNALSISYT